MVAAMAFPAAATYPTHFQGGALHLGRTDHCLFGFYPQTISSVNSRRASVSIKWVSLLLIIPLRLGSGFDESWGLLFTVY